MTNTRSRKRPADCPICGWPMTVTLPGARVVATDTCNRTWLHWTRESLAAEDAARAARRAQN